VGNLLGLEGEDGVVAGPPGIALAGRDQQHTTGGAGHRPVGHDHTPGSAEADHDMDVWAGLHAELKIRAAIAHQMGVVDGQVGHKLKVVPLGGEAPEVLDRRRGADCRIGLFWTRKPLMPQALQHRREPILGSVQGGDRCHR